jgi:hypothetical protein
MYYNKGVGCITNMGGLDVIQWYIYVYITV